MLAPWGIDELGHQAPNRCIDPAGMPATAVDDPGQPLIMSLQLHEQGVEQIKAELATCDPAKSGA